MIGTINQIIRKNGDKGTAEKPVPLRPLKADLWQAFALATYWREAAGSGRRRPFEYRG